MNSVPAQVMDTLHQSVKSSPVVCSTAKNACSCTWRLTKLLLLLLLLGKIRWKIGGRLANLDVLRLTAPGDTASTPRRSMMTTTLMVIGATDPKQERARRKQEPCRSAVEV